MLTSLWNAPGRGEWFGGGFDVPGIHSLCVDLRDSKPVLAGVPCGGVSAARDSGETWVSSAKGMRAD